MVNKSLRYFAIGFDFCMENHCTSVRRFQLMNASYLQSGFGIEFFQKTY